MIGPNI